MDLIIQILGISLYPINGHYRFLRSVNSMLLSDDPYQYTIQEYLFITSISTTRTGQLVFDILICIVLAK